jgi:hypothetical protein
MAPLHTVHSSKVVRLARRGVELFSQGRASEAKSVRRIVLTSTRELHSLELKASRVAPGTSTVAPAKGRTRRLAGLVKRE